MKPNAKIFLLSVFGATLASCSCPNKEVVITDPLIRFCESTLPYDNDQLLIANFGTEQLNPLNQEGKGYIVIMKKGVISSFIPVDGNLNAPKGMGKDDEKLYICDVNKIVVYDLDDRSKAPQTIRFPEGDLFVNDLFIKDNLLYATVTNTGRIYKIDISNDDSLSIASPQLFCEVPGANGIVIEKDKMYVASYPPDGTTTEANVVYVINDLKNPVPEKLITISGQYDGLAFSDDKKTLYVSSWSPAGLFAIDMKSKAITPIKMKNTVVGPADFSRINGKLIIPDLPNSQLIEMEVE